MRRLAFASLLLAIAVLAGCGEKTKTKTEKTKTEPKGGNGKKPTVALKDKVVGKWKSSLEIDDDLLKKLLIADNVPADKLDETLKKTKEQLPAMTMEFDGKADGTFVVTTMGAGPEPEAEKGKWELVSEEGAVLKLKTTEKDDKGKEKPKTITLTFKGDDEYTFETDDPEFKQAPFESPITFKRVK